MSFTLKKKYKWNLFHKLDPFDTIVKHTTVSCTVRGFNTSLYKLKALVIRI